MDDYVAKPVESNGLQPVISRTLARPRGPTPRFELITWFFGGLATGEIIAGRVDHVAMGAHGKALLA